MALTDLAARLELAARAAKGRLEAGLSSALADMTAEWTAAGYPLAVDSPVTWLLGYDPTVVERPRADFPIVAVMALRAESGEGADQWGAGEGKGTLLIHWFVDADTAQECYVSCLRYGQAILRVMRSDLRLAAGVELQDYSPRLELSTIARDLDEIAGTDQAWYSEAGEMVWDLVIRDAWRI